MPTFCIYKGGKKVATVSPTPAGTKHIGHVITQDEQG